MSKLFEGEEIAPMNVSLEEFSKRYNASVFISREAIQDYFYKLKDVISTTNESIFNSDLEKASLDATKDKYEVINISKRIHIAHLSDEVVTTPDKFKGTYLDLLLELKSSSGIMYEDTIKLLSNIKMAVASFINEVSKDGALSIYGVSYSKNSKKKREECLKKVSKFFPHSKSITKAKATDVLKSLKDLEVIFKEVPELAKVSSEYKIDKLLTLSKEVSEMVDILIEQNANSGVLTNNSTAKKDLVDMLQVGATNVEFCGYLYSNTLFLYKAIKDLSDTVIRVGNR